jgi:hypothetical protein
MKSATKKLTVDIAESLSEKINSVSTGSKKIKKSIEKAAAKLAKKVVKFEKETLKKKEKEAKNAEKKSKGKDKKEGKKHKHEKVAALVAEASSKVPVAPPAKPVTSKPAGNIKTATKTESKPTETLPATVEAQDNGSTSAE